MRDFTKQEATVKLEEIIVEINNLRDESNSSPIFKKWHRDTQVALEYIFGPESRHVKDFNNIRFFLGAVSNLTPRTEFQKAYVVGLDSATAILESMISEVAQYWDEEHPIDVKAGRKSHSKSSDHRKVFIVHGHDQGVKEAVARFITKIGLVPVILHEQPNEGRTVIEKFEDFSDVPYAIALLTPDDIGASVKDPENLRDRARQNVLFEFGFFIGLLGRRNVCGLVRGDLDLPSDYGGVLYVPYDEADGWKLPLVKELKAAGFDVDANLAI